MRRQNNIVLFDKVAQSNQQWLHMFFFIIIYFEENYRTDVFDAKQTDEKVPYSMQF